MEVWQGKRLAADFADVWQIQELVASDEWREEEAENGKVKMEIGKKKSLGEPFAEIVLGKRLGGVESHDTVA